VNDTKRSSYGDILKSSSLIGGAQGLNYLISLLRTKAVALLIGPSGIGLVGIYSTALGFMATATGLGIANSGVREISEAQASGDSNRLHETIVTLQRTSLLIGVISCVFCVLLSNVLSRMAFGNTGHSAALSALGITLFLGTLVGSNNAIVQGLRRIPDLARINILSAVIGTVVAVSIYAIYGASGIVPALTAVALVQWLVSWCYVRKIQASGNNEPWITSIKRARSLVKFGIIFMWAGLLGATVELAIRSMIVQRYGLEGNGIYQAAWNLSGMFAGFVLNAMGADFYPRLSAASGDNEIAARMVNEQMEIGMLLALPGLMGTLTFAPWVMSAFYSAEFRAGGALLPWFVGGVFLQVVSWPLGYLIIGKGAKAWYAVSETSLFVMKLVLVPLFMVPFGLIGSAIAFQAVMVCYTVLVFVISRRVASYKVSRNTRIILLTCVSCITVGFIVSEIALQHTKVPLLSTLTAFACWFSAKGILNRLDNSNSLVQAAYRLPMSRILFGPIKN